MGTVAIRALAAISALWCGAAWAQTVTVDSRADGASLDIAWAERTSAAWREDGLEIVLRFGRPVSTFDAADAQTRLGAWVEAVSAGYDSILLRARTGVRAAVAETPTGLRVDFARALAGGADPAQEKRLEQLRARLEAESGKAADADARLQKLEREAPTDADVLVQRAGVAERLGRWPLALDLYDRAGAARPDDLDIRESRRRLARERQPQVRIEPDYQSVHGGDRQWMLRGSAFYYPEPGREAGTAVEARHISDGNLRHLDGGSRPADLWREKAELFYGLETSAGVQVRGRLLVSTGTPGVGVERIERGGGHELRLGAVYREAFWDLKEGIPANATVDRVQGRWQKTTEGDVTLNAGASLNRYAVEGDVDVARTAKWDAGLRQGFKLLGDESSLGYMVDAETVGHRDVRPGPTGEAFYPLPFRTRETHSVDLTLRHEFGFETWAALQGGWSFDRLTVAKGPFANVKFSHEPAENVEAGMKAGFAHTTGRGSDGLSRNVGAYVAVRF